MDTDRGSHRFRTWPWVVSDTAIATMLVRGWPKMTLETNRKSQMDTVKSNAADDLAALRADLAALQRDMAMLVRHTAGGLKSDGLDAIGTLDGAARQMLDGVTHQGEAAVKAIGNKIEEKPILTLLVLLAASYAAGRLLMR